MHLSFKNFLDIAPSEHGFTIRSSHENSNFLVVYNERKSHSTIRFTLAHELGHIRLNHFCDDDISNKEANCFARNTLCPIPIINEFNLATASDYSSCFNISELMAKASILHKDSDLYYITNYNFSRINDKVYSYFTGNSIAELYS
ncbi:MAG: ImmA/IrrE family metallo-endopeptidase [Clostridia bacterium]|nr:ImmA/IrrE family metallo-endopeptidase [Clostridia bacterium]